MDLLWAWTTRNPGICLISFLKILEPEIRNRNVNILCSSGLVSIQNGTLRFHFMLDSVMPWDSVVKSTEFPLTLTYVSFQANICHHCGTSKEHLQYFVSSGILSPISYCLWFLNLYIRWQVTSSNHICHAAHRAEARQRLMSSLCLYSL